MKVRLPLLAALAVTVLPHEVFAQAWVSNPDFSEGIGIRAGDLEVHPSLAGEFGYDSNYFRASGSGPGEDVIDVLRLRVTPSLSLTTLGRQRRNSPTPPSVAFKASVYGAYNEIIPLDSAESDVSEQRNIGVGADAKLDIYPQGKVGADLLAAFVRTVEPDGSTSDLVSAGFSRDTVRGGGGVTWRPGGGLFEWRVGYNATYNFFEEDTYDSLANLRHEIGTRGRWRFLPRSALLFDSTYTFVNYTNSDAQQTDGDAVRARIGFHGLVTYHLALLGMVGWGSSFYESRGGVGLEAQQYDSLLANAEARWFLMARPNLDEATVVSGLSSVALGYGRVFDNSYLGSFYQRDRGYLQFDLFLLGSIVGGLEFGVSSVSYPDVVQNGLVQESFNQLRLDGRAFGEYRITDTWAVNATFLFDRVSSSAEVNDEDLDYNRWQAYLGVRWFM
jgi:hypothetical protein